MSDRSPGDPNARAAQPPLSETDRLRVQLEQLRLGFDAAKDHLHQLDAVKTDFITIASHELRTPLAQIRGYIDIFDALNESGALDPNQAALLAGNLRKATERMEELITAMLDVSQIDVNALDLRLAPASLEGVVRMAIEPLTDAFRARKLTLLARGLRGLPTINADMQRLMQAFRNVIVNAVKYTPDGGRIEINASMRPANGPDDREFVVVAITDTGIGIEPDKLELIFHKFYRGQDPHLHSTGAYKFMGAGPGLGLTIARGIIEGHGGEIWAESSGYSLEHFPGSTFYILLPVQPPGEQHRVRPFETEARRHDDVTLPSAHTLRERLKAHV
jgi:signal transduction histidine kinase